MKTILSLTFAFVFAAFVAAPGSSRADDPVPAKPKPYPLQTCLVCNEKFDSMGVPFVFVYQGREIKLCCPADKVVFDKDPAKYMKKLDAAEAKLKK